MKFVLLVSIALAAAPAGFGAIDISTLSGDGKAALANADKVCPPGSDPKTLSQKGELGESAELQLFNPAIAAAPDAKTKAAIQCQKARNKVLKNECLLNEAKVTKDQAKITLHTTQVNKDVTEATSACANVDATLFISTGGNGAKATKTAKGTKAKGKAKTTKAKTTKSTKVKATKGKKNTKKATQAAAPKTGNGNAPAGFSAIDISKLPGDGAQASINANKVCPVGANEKTLAQDGSLANATEESFFNPAIQAATDAKTKAAIQCQKNRNKVLKNTCFLNSAKAKGDQANIDKHSKQLVKNTADATSSCANVDSTLFI
ncbi:hypothetical protein HDV06_007140 [Boothiomyces sp. JEL0866]|nr:hypothetical protein HDV06_007140 [Boothiomyces sp. JEL0866]